MPLVRGYYYYFIDNDEYTALCASGLDEDVISAFSQDTITHNGIAYHYALVSDLAGFLSDIGGYSDLEDLGIQMDTAQFLSMATLNLTPALP